MKNNYVTVHTHKLCRIWELTMHEWNGHTNYMTYAYKRYAILNKQHLFQESTL